MLPTCEREWSKFGVCHNHLKIHPKNMEKPGITKGLATCQFLGARFSHGNGWWLWWTPKPNSAQFVSLMQAASYHSKFSEKGEEQEPALQFLRSDGRDWLSLNQLVICVTAFEWALHSAFATSEKFVALFSSHSADWLLLNHLFYCAEVCIFAPGLQVTNSMSSLTIIQLLYFICSLQCIRFSPCVWMDVPGFFEGFPCVRLQRYLFFP